jgi:signal transduction histidine kinase
VKRKSTNFSRRYQAALRAFLKNGPEVRLGPAEELGKEAQAARRHPLELATVHERTLIAELLPGHPKEEWPALIKRAGAFFAVAIAPNGTTRRSQPEATTCLKQTIRLLSERAVALAASNLELGLEITQRKAAEKSLEESKRHYSALLEKSDHLQEQLRGLSRQLLSAQEEERKKISRELHDVVAQTLTGINVRLAALARKAAVNTKGLDHNIARTQRLVEKSVNIVHQFARELRPAVLDDLGLIPAIHSFMKQFSVQTGVRIHLTAYKGVERLDTARRTVLFRVAQEALNNVARHARATRVDVSIQKLPGAIGMSIRDDGKSFEVNRILDAKSSKRLGVLGMRERVEMVGGKFDIKSALGQGTTVSAQIFLNKVPVRRLLNSSGRKLKKI